MKEVFVPVKGYEGKYEISNLRRIKSLGRVCHKQNGGQRKINERFIYSDKESVCLGQVPGKIGHGNSQPVLQILASSFYPEYSSDKYTIKSRKKQGATLADIMLIKKMNYNKVSVYDGEDVVTYDNLQEFCKRFNVNQESFIDTLNRGWFKSNYTPKLKQFDGWTFAFESPLMMNGEYKLIFTIFDYTHQDLNFMRKLLKEK